ncbi:hypothetical protein Cgig2_007303 [Carnegiea gigantea]|uniref:Uncharacterized protein n=1 Tax=Carnegiea gigantea TaxID=171969 RepID=A0A9Q1KXQ4_9CARY|nr:hypothetical protein Cgig2_007303 [Carnegiea gigantea]
MGIIQLQRPIVGLHVVLPLHLHLSLRPPLSHPPPPPLPPPPAAATHPAGPHPGVALPLHGPHLLHHLIRHPFLLRRRDPRHAVVLAAEQDPFSVAPLFPTGHTPLGPGLLLVIRVLPLSIPPPPQDLLLSPPAPPPPDPPPPDPLDPRLHVLPMARILTVISSACDHIHDARGLRHLRVSILDGDRTSERVLSVRTELPDRPSWVYYLRNNNGENKNHNHNHHHHCHHVAGSDNSQKMNASLIKDL